MPRVASSAAFASIFACKAAFVDPPRRLLFLLVCSGPTSAAELLLAESWLCCVLAESSLSFGAMSTGPAPVEGLQGLERLIAVALNYYP